MAQNPSTPSPEALAFHAAAESGDVAGVNAYLSSAAITEKIQKKDRAEYSIFTDAMQLAIHAKHPVLARHWPSARHKKKPQPSRPAPNNLEKRVFD